MAEALGRCTAAFTAAAVLAVGDVSRVAGRHAGTGGTRSRWKVLRGGGLWGSRSSGRCELAVLAAFDRAVGAEQDGHVMVAVQWSRHQTLSPVPGSQRSTSHARQSASRRETASA